MNERLANLMHGDAVDLRRMLTKDHGMRYDRGPYVAQYEPDAVLKVIEWYLVQAYKEGFKDGSTPLAPTTETTETE